MFPKFLKTVFGGSAPAAAARDDDGPVDLGKPLPADPAEARAEIHRRIMAGEPVPLIFTSAEPPKLTT